MRLKTSSADDSVNYRYSGILVHPTSFPSPYGIGDFGKGAYDFIDFLEASGQHLWQILPLNPITSYGNSPYQGFSVFAGEPLLLSPQLLKEQGLLAEEDLRVIPDFDPVRVDYEAVRAYKYPLYRKAYQNFLEEGGTALQEVYDDFCARNEDWLSDYCLYMAIKDEQEGLPWTKWPEALRNLSEKDRAFWTQKLEKEIGYYAFLQFCFRFQWASLKEYANDRGIAIIGDIPIFVSPDGADVWANRELFQVDTKGYPSVVAGVPPDYFSATGQMWGNPLYDWAAHKKDGYRWWIARVRHLLEQADYVRIDHFRGFDTYWAIPAGSETARTGRWETGPRMDLFRALEGAMGELPIIAEDLGELFPSVRELLAESGFPGMKVLQFAFSGGDNEYLPHNHIRNCVIYPGTHDNTTLADWWENAATAKEKANAAAYLHLTAACKPTEKQVAAVTTDAARIALIRAALASSAQRAIIPMYDWLGIGAEAHLNTPGKLGGNWAWRAEQGFAAPALAKQIREECEVCFRGR